MTTPTPFRRSRSSKRSVSELPPLVSTIEAPREIGRRILPGFDFADAHRFLTPAQVMAPHIAAMMFDRPPAWIAGLMEARNRLGGKLGLREASLSGFPVIEESPEATVLGLDDQHLDFRILVMVEKADDGSAVTLATFVRQKNWLGRAYLAVVYPFHKIISAVVARRLAAALREPA